MEFKTIETQEEFDARIAERLARERDKYKDYEDLKRKNTSYESDLTKANDDIKKLNETKADLERQINELNSKVKTHETNSVKMRICHDKGLPYEFAERLTGETEEDIVKDADSMAKLFNTMNPEPYAEDNKGNPKEEAYKKLLGNLK